MKIIYRYAFLGCMFAALAGCSAAPPVQQDSTPPEEVVVSAPEPQKAVITEPVKKPEPAPVKQEAPVEKKEPTPVQEPQPSKPEPPVKKEVPAVKQEAPVEKKEPIVEKEPEPVADEKNEVIAEFEGVTITKETYVQTKSEIEKVVDQLNRITATKDYAQWIQFLSNDYKREYSKPATLKIVSEALPVKGIKLKSLKDYFTYVFVPSRQKIRVDDIHFVSPSHVDVIMKQGSVSLLIYSIENVSGSWKLIPPEL